MIMDWKLLPAMPISWNHVLVNKQMGKYKLGNGLEINKNDPIKNNNPLTRGIGQNCPSKV